jgi:peptide methionine sulfoxide reductase MsrA
VIGLNSNTFAQGYICCDVDVRFHKLPLRVATMLRFARRWYFDRGIQLITILAMLRMSGGLHAGCLHGRSLPYTSFKEQLQHRVCFRRSWPRTVGQSVLVCPPPLEMCIRGTCNHSIIPFQNHFTRHAALRFGFAALLAAGVKADAGTCFAAEELQLLYVGAGCFWHVQHEMVLAEHTLLGRSSSSFTAIAGYAGGTKVGAGNLVCYHNQKARDTDYGKLGHTEVVAVRVPSHRVADFTRQFLALFDVQGLRSDPQDKGGEYRSAIGLRDGLRHPIVPLLKTQAAKRGMRLVEGVGDEGDTLQERIIYVYDTQKFPFHAGELYHQYHNDMVGTYGKEYAALRDVALNRGTLSLSQCPGDSAIDTPLEALSRWAKDSYSDWKLERSRLDAGKQNSGTRR